MSKMRKMRPLRTNGSIIKLLTADSDVSLMEISLTFNLGTEADLPLILLRLKILARSRSLLVHLTSCRGTRPVWGASSRDRTPSRTQPSSSQTPATALPQFRIPSAPVSLVIVHWDRSSMDLEDVFALGRCLFRSITKDEALVRRGRSICGVTRLAIRNCSVFVTNSCDLLDRDSVLERYLVVWTPSMTSRLAEDTLRSKFSERIWSSVSLVLSPRKDSLLSFWFSRDCSSILEESSEICSPVPGAEAVLLRARPRASVLEDTWIDRVKVSRYCGFTTVVYPSSSRIFLRLTISSDTCHVDLSISRIRMKLALLLLEPWTS